MTETSAVAEGTRMPASLLWPEGAHESPGRLDPDAVRDLGAADLAAALGADAAGRRVVEQVLYQLCRDPRVIRYRQDILADLLALPALVARLAGLMPALGRLSGSRYRPARDRSVLHEVLWRLSELESFVDCVDALHAALEEAGDALHSAGLRALRAAVAATAGDPTYQALQRELPALLAQARTAASVTIGVNLDHNLQPVEVTLLSINDQRFRGSRLLGKLFGAAGSDWQGIGSLHGLPDQVADASRAARNGFTPMMVPLFRDLAQVLSRSAEPVARALKGYADVNTGLLHGLSHELPFYLGAVRLVDWLAARGLPACRPELAPIEERVCQVREAYNLALALRFGAGEPRDLSPSIVPNDVDFGPAGRVIVLTGPNQGGKTTYIQSIGLIQLLAQAGLHVPGTRARISPADAVYTHFPVEERPEQGTGRFGEEARRLHDIFARVTPYSLVLLNESLSSTSAGESLYLGQDILRVLRRLGARAIFATHLHELAAGVAELNAAEPGDGPILSMVASHVAGQDGVARSYQVRFGPPLGRSYAREIAARYGVSYEQLTHLLAERGLLDRLEPSEDGPEQAS